MTVRTKEAEVPSEFPPARLYLDDIEQIVRILVDAVENSKRERKASDEESIVRVNFRIKDQVCDEVNELREIAPKTRELEIGVQKREWGPTASITFTKYLTFMSVGSFGREEQLSIHHHLAQVFKRRKRWLTSLIDAHRGTFGVLLVLMSYLAFTPLYFLSNKQSPPMLAFLIGILSAIILGTILIAGFRHSTIVLRNSSERYALRQEMIWKSIPMVVSSILSFILGMITVVLKHKYWP